VEGLVADIVAVVRQSASQGIEDAFRGARPRSRVSVTNTAVPSSAASARAMTIAADRGLSPRETALYLAAVEGVPRSYLAKVLGISENTVKTQTRVLLRKLGHRRLDDAVWAVVSRGRSGSPANARAKRRRA
jgi:DNA-binding NarL/FixJ family response regulator